MTDCVFVILDMRLGTTKSGFDGVKMDEKGKVVSWNFTTWLIKNFSVSYHITCILFIQLDIQQRCIVWHEIPIYELGV